MKKIFSTILVLFYITNIFGYANIDHYCSMSISNEPIQNHNKCCSDMTEKNIKESACCSTETDRVMTKKDQTNENTDHSNFSTNCCSFEIQVNETIALTYPLFEKNIHFLAIFQMYSERNHNSFKLVQNTNFNNNPTILSINLPLLI